MDTNALSAHRPIKAATKFLAIHRDCCSLRHALWLDQIFAQHALFPFPVNTGKRAASACAADVKTGKAIYLKIRRNGSKLCAHCCLYASTQWHAFLPPPHIFRNNTIDRRVHRHVDSCLFICRSGLISLIMLCLSSVRFELISLPDWIFGLLVMFL